MRWSGLSNLPGASRPGIMSWTDQSDTFDRSKACTVRNWCVSFDDRLNGPGDRINSQQGSSWRMRWLSVFYDCFLCCLGRPTGLSVEMLFRWVACLMDYGRVETAVVAGWKLRDTTPERMNFSLFLIFCNVRVKRKTGCVENEIDGTMRLQRIFRIFSQRGRVTTPLPSNQAPLVTRIAFEIWTVIMQGERGTYQMWKLLRHVHHGDTIEKDWAMPWNNQEVSIITLSARLESST